MSDQDGANFCGPFRLAVGWYVLVAGVQHGPWPVKGYAQAGYEVELRRHSNRAAAGSVATEEDGV